MAVPENLVTLAIQTIDRNLESSGEDGPIDFPPEETILIEHGVSQLPDKPQSLVRKIHMIRSWLMVNGNPYDEQSGERREDEEGWFYEDDVIKMSADNTAIPANVDHYFQLSLTESPSRYYPSADVWFAVTDESFSKYNLLVSFFEKADINHRRQLRYYTSFDASFEEMPAVDKVIATDLLTRTTKQLIKEVTP